MLLLHGPLTCNQRSSAHMQKTPSDECKASIGEAPTGTVGTYDTVMHCTVQDAGAVPTVTPRACPPGWAVDRWLGR